MIKKSMILLLTVAILNTFSIPILADSLSATSSTKNDILSDTVLSSGYVVLDNSMSSDELFDLAENDVLYSSEYTSVEKKVYVDEGFEIEEIYIYRDAVSAVDSTVAITSVVLMSI